MRSKKKLSLHLNAPKPPKPLKNRFGGLQVQPTGYINLQLLGETGTLYTLNTFSDIGYSF